MISVTEAKAIIDELVKPLDKKSLPLSAAAGLVLAEDVFATMDIPAFNQSSMDGYAFSFEGWQLNKPLQLTGEIPAGASENISILPSQAIRIFTGAAVPSSCDTVVMQEKVSVTNNDLLIIDDKILPGLNVRPIGSEIKKGALALAKNTVLSPGAIGFLAGIGIINVSVFPKPTVGIIVTGNELQQPGNPLLFGQVYESNSQTLTAALQQLHINTVKTFSAADDLFIVKEVLQTALNQCDIILLTGGVSVGDYDFVVEAARLCEVEMIFHKIKQRPGKPLYFGKIVNQLVFGLPGNPSSVLTCFYQYVLPAVQQLSNFLPSGLKVLQVPINKNFTKAAGLTHFLKGYYDGKKVAVLDAQESYRLSSFARANCLVKINEDITHCEEGEIVEIHLLP